MKKLTLAVLFSSVALTAYANPKAVDEKFNKLDADKSGGITLEAGSEKKLHDGYTAADADKDGKVTLEEYTKFEKAEKET